jgi:hypothetical protein
VRAWYWREGLAASLRSSRSVRRPWFDAAHGAKLQPHADACKTAGPMIASLPYVGWEDPRGTSSLPAELTAGGRRSPEWHTACSVRLGGLPVGVCLVPRGQPAVLRLQPLAAVRRIPCPGRVRGRPASARRIRFDAAARSCPISCLSGAPTLVQWDRLPSLLAAVVRPSLPAMTS